MPAANCPDRDKLRAYAAGDVFSETAECLADHINTCTDCQAALETIDDAEDSLVVRLRRAPARDKYQDESQYEEAMARAAAAAGGLLPSGDEQTIDGTAPVQTADLQEVGEYQLLEKLGQGGMGTVYKALHTKLRRVVALKLLPKDRMDDLKAVARFEREMAAIGRLDHPNIVRATHAGEHEGTSYLVMDYVEGLDLSEVARRCGPLPVADACELVRQAAVGLQYVHDNGLVHRDIKPSNLMLTSHGQVKVLDLGLALLHENQPAEGEVTATGQAMGTADYIAPEQTADSHTVDIRADVYSLGCTLFRLLTGRAPYVGKNYKNAFEKMMGHVRDPLPSIKELRGDLPEKLVAVVEQMLAKNPDDRPAMPEAVAEAMGPFVRAADLPQLIQWAETHAASPEADAETFDGTKEYVSSAAITEDNAPYARYRQAQPSSRRRSRWPVVLVGLAVAGVLAFGAIFTVVTNRGTLEIKTHDDNVEVSILKGGKEVAILDTETGNKVTLYAGDYELKLSGGGADLQLSRDKITLRRDDKVIVEVVRKSTSPAVRPSELITAKFSPEGEMLNARTQFSSLLPLVDPNRDAVSGPWRLERGELHAALGGDTYKRTTIPVVPVGSYQLRVLFTRTGGVGDVAVMLPAGSGSTMLALSSFAGTVSGLHNVGGQDARANETSCPGSLSNGVPHTLLITVRLQSDQADVDVKLDDRFYIAWKGPQSVLSQNSTWHMPYTEAFGLGAKAIIVFHSVELRMLDGTASRLSAESARSKHLLPNGWVIHEPVNLGPTVNSSFEDSQPGLSADGLTLLFSSKRPGGLGDADLWKCTRASVSEPFEEPVNLGETVNSSSHDSHPGLSADGLTLLFGSNRPGGLGSWDLWMCTRTTPSEAFGEPVNLGPTVNSEFVDDSPVLSTDGLTLAFHSHRPSELGGQADLWMSTRARRGEPFGKPVNLGEPVNSSAWEGNPALSADGLTLVFCSNRSGGEGSLDLWMCTRTSPSEAFGEPVNLGPTVNGRHWDGSPTFSADGRTLLFDSNRPGGHGDFDLWMARIEQRGAPRAQPVSETTSAAKDSPIAPAGTSANVPADTLPEGTIDLLARIQVPRDVVYHHWQSDNKGWVMRDEAIETPRGPWGVLEVPYYPPEEYELVAEVERVEGNGDFGLGVVSNDARFSVEFDCWANLGWLTGFGRLDGRDLNEVDSKDVYTGQLLPLGARRTIVLTVGKSAASVECGDKKVLDYQGPLSRLSLQGAWPRRDPTVLQILSYNGVFRVHKLTVRPLCETPALPTQFVDEPFNGHDLTGWLEFRRDGIRGGKWQAGEANWTPDQPEIIQWSEGSGALVNCVADKDHGVNLFTSQRWGDCRVTLEFLVHGGHGGDNSSGVYLMGRYQVELVDSYEPGKTQPLSKDCGTVFPLGDWTKPKLPEVSAEKPPGEWQTLEVEFLAPRFDAVGKKIADARFKSVKLSGRQVQTNVEVRWPDPDGMRGEESTGPLMLEGYNTTVAFRNIKVQSLLPEATDKKSSAERAAGQLQDENADVRVSAALTLAQMGDRRALEPSLAALKEKDPKVRREAAKSLGCLRDERALEPLIATIKDDDLEVRYWAACSLGAIGDTRAVEPLIAALKDQDVWVRGGIAGALAALGDKRAAEPLRAALRRDDGTVVTPVAVALAGLLRDESAVGPLLAALDHPESEWTELEVFQGVVAIGPRAMKPLVAGLRHGNVRVRRAIVFILTETGHEGAVEALISALKDTDGDVARSAAYGLAELDDPRGLQPLTVVLKDPESAVWRKTEVPLREKAASLGLLPANAPPNLAPLIAALEDEHWNLRLSAAWVLGRLGDNRAAEALAAVLKTVEHADQVDCRLRGTLLCAQALARLGSSLAVPTLVTTLRHDSARDEHPVGLSETYAWLELSQEWVSKEMDAWSMRLQQKSVSKILEALAAVGPAAVDPLIVLLKDENPGVRSAAAQGLGGLGDKRALDALKAALKDVDQQVQESAAEAICAIESKSLQ